MALLSELGHKYPVSTEGVPIDLQNETQTMGPGDIVEAWYEADRDISYLNIAPAIEELIKMKEEYPDFVLHYIRFENRRVYVQFSAAPPESAISANPQRISASIQALTWGIVLMILAIAAIVTAFIAVNLRAIRGYWWTPPQPMGDAVILCQNYDTKLGIPDVAVSVDGEPEGTTDFSGACLVRNLLAGQHLFGGETVEGYQIPDTVQDTIIKDQQIEVTILYYTGPKPPTGELTVYTWPITGEVFIDGEPYGEAPVGPITLPRGEHEISFGPVASYITPPVIEFTLQGGAEVSKTGVYESAVSPWEKYLKWGLIGVGIITGAALVIPEAIRALMRRGESK